MQVIRHVLSCTFDRADLKFEKKIFFFVKKKTKNTTIVQVHGSKADVTYYVLACSIVCSLNCVISFALPVVLC